jgi:hypothetical protein
MKKDINALKLSNEEVNRITKDSIQEALVYLLSKKNMNTHLFSIIMVIKVNLL